MTNVYYFSAEWCGPCKVFKPVVQQASQETGKYVQFIDIDKNKLMADQYEIKSVPTLLVVNDQGQIINRLIGVQSKTTITSLLSIS